jgi:methionyl-tRNA formyltransferase
VAALEALVAAGAAPVAVFTLRPDLAANRSGAADYSAVCNRLGLPLHYVANINDEETVASLHALEPDVLFVIGWSQVLRAPALGCARVGIVGAHASLLPHGRGGAPINWALIRGAQETGNSLIWLSEELDAGDVIDQTTIPITAYDTCETLYERVAQSNRDMILRMLPRLIAGERPGAPQRRNGTPMLPRRRPADGLIDWTCPNNRVYDFVRALTRPYPGAFSWIDGRRWIVWQTSHLPASVRSAACPGEVIGPVVSPIAAACGQAVACGHGPVVLLELEDEDGRIWQGARLADLKWTGKVWGRG